MAITRGIKDKLDKYGINLPTDKRTRRYQNLLLKEGWTEEQYKNYLKQVIQRYTKKEKKIVRQVQEQNFRAEVAERVRIMNIRKVHYVGSIYLKYIVLSTTKSYTTDTFIQFDETIVPEQLNKEIKIKVDMFIENVLTSYEDISNIEIKEQDNNIIQKTNGTQLRDIKMKDAGAGLIDGYNTQDWDTQTNKCVFDYLIHKYSKVKGFIGTCKNYETLNEFFQDTIDDTKDYLNDGISTAELLNFCQRFKLPMYAIDDDKKCFEFYQPEKRNQMVSGIVYRLCNNHFYPVESRNEIQRVVQATANVSSEIMSYEKRKTELKECEEEEQHTNVEYVDDILKKLCEFVRDKQIPDDFKWSKNQLYSFKYKETTYITNENVDMVKALCANMGKEFKGQGLGTIILDIYKEVYENDRMPKSVHNPEVLKILRDVKRNRPHYGYINEAEANKSDFSECEAYDLIKCYRTAMYSPLDKWLVLDFNDCWEYFDYKYYENLRTGLYYIETDDTSLFKKSNVYSNKIIEYAREVGIHFKIIYQLVPRSKDTLLQEDYFRPLIDKIIEYGKGDENIAKLPINMISGLLGKSETESTKVHLNKDTNQILEWLDTYSQTDNSVIYCKLPLKDENRFLYGIKKQFKSMETNIPMYIQILDHSNILLHKMCHNINGELVARKSDCAIFRNVKNEVQTSDEWGGIRKCELPTIHKEEVCEEYVMNIDEEWNEHEIGDSNEWERIMDVLEQKNGLLLQGNAGNGKTWVAKNIIKKYGNRVKVLAPTNKAALNISGSTIHLFLKMSAEGKLSRKLLDIIKDRFDLIVVDEISMIDKEMWRRLCLMKQQTHVKFLLLGDDKQCPPVEVDGLESYFNHPAVRYLTNNQRNTLTIRKRYDEKLYDMLKDVNNIDVEQFPYKETQVNICFYNDTKKHINKMWNDKLKTNNSLFIPMNEDDDNSQDMYVYEGLPVIATRNKRNDEGILWANSEKFNVINYDNENVILHNERPNDDGEPEMYGVEISIDDFKNNFCLNYCCTTHKTQGETLTENFTIYDWNKMNTKLKYTALSRAKSPEQVHISKIVIPRSPDTFESNIRKKIQGYKEQDKKNKFKNNIKVQDVKELYEVQNGECKFCGCGMLKTFKANDDKQFSVDRIDSKSGHTKDNIQLLCWGCNRSKQNRM